MGNLQINVSKSGHPLGECQPATRHKEIEHESSRIYSQARTLMGPGPSDVHPEILTAMARPTIGHLDPQFIQLMDDIKHKLQWAFQTKNALTLPISAPGSANGSVFANLVNPGIKYWFAKTAYLVATWQKM